MAEEDRQAIHDLTRMAFMYIERGEEGKAKELMQLAHDIENRIKRLQEPVSQEQTS